MISSTGLAGIGARRDIATDMNLDLGADVALNQSRRSRSKASGSNQTLPRDGIPTSVRQGGLAIARLKGALLNLSNGYVQCVMTDHAKKEDLQKCQNARNVCGARVAGSDIDSLQKMVKAQIAYLEKVEAALARLQAKAKAKRPGDAMVYRDQLREMAVISEKLAALRGRFEGLKKAK